MIAVSSASVPLVVKKLFLSFPGVIWVSRAATVTCSRRVDAGRMHQPRDLILNPLHEFRMGMPDPRGQNAAEEVEVLAPVEILHGRAVRLGDDDGLGVVIGDAGEEELFVLLAYGLRIQCHSPIGVWCLVCGV